MNISKLIVGFGLVILVILNILVFVSSSQMSDRIVIYNTKTQELTKKNTQLEAKLYTIDSLSHAASAAATLGYTQKVEPTFVKRAQDTIALLE